MSSRPISGELCEIGRARAALAQAAGAAFLIALVGPAALAFKVDYASYGTLFLFAAATALLLPYAAWRKMQLFHSALLLTCIAPLISLAILIATYCAMRLCMPMADEQLLAYDRLIGFDWVAFVRAVDTSPLLANALQFGYAAFAFELLLAPMLLCLLGFEARAYRFMLAFLLLGLLSALFSIPFPSNGAYVAHGLDGATLQHVDARFGYFFLESFRGVREQADFVLAAGNVAGIITFPSVHAGVAVICAWAAWPARLLRYPALVVNGLMFVSALSHGAHFLVDLIAGAAVALLSIRLALAWSRAATRTPDPAAVELPARPALQRRDQSSISGVIQPLT